MLIVLGIAALLSWQVNKVREQRQAVPAIQKFGGWVHYDYEFVDVTVPSGQPLLRQRAGATRAANRTSSSFLSASAICK